MDYATAKLRGQIQEKGISIAKIAKNTGFPYSALWGSLSEGTRTLRADEFLSVCAFLEKNPAEYRDPKTHEAHKALES